MNKVNLIGRLTRDIDLRVTTSDKPVARFTLAVNRPTNEEADFIQCKAWNKRAEVMAKYLHKGSLVGITGRLQTGKYTNNDGQTVYTNEVVVENFYFLEPKRNNIPDGYEAYE